MTALLFRWSEVLPVGRISPAVPCRYPSFCAVADLVLLAGLFGATRG